MELKSRFKFSSEYERAGERRGGDEARSRATKEICVLASRAKSSVTSGHGSIIKYRRTEVGMGQDREQAYPAFNLTNMNKIVPIDLQQSLHDLV